MPLRWLCLALWGLGLSGCASFPDGSQVLESFATEWERPPQPGDWCRIELVTERIAPISQKLGFLTGRVAAVDGRFVQLTDVTEEERVLAGPMSFRRWPYLSRMTSADSEFHLHETRHIARDQIRGWRVISADDAAQNRQTLVEVGGKLVRKPIGLDFDFDIPTPPEFLLPVDPRPWP